MTKFHDRIIFSSGSLARTHSFLFPFYTYTCVYINRVTFVYKRRVCATHWNGRNVFAIERILPLLIVIIKIKFYDVIARFVSDRRRTKEKLRINLKHMTYGPRSFRIFRPPFSTVVGRGLNSFLNVSRQQPQPPQCAIFSLIVTFKLSLNDSSAFRTTLTFVTLLFNALPYM